MGGIDSLFAAEPQNPITLATAITLVVGSFISGGTTTPNYTRFAKTKKIAVIATVIAFFVGNSLMFVFGAVGGSVTGRYLLYYDRTGISTSGDHRTWIKYLDHSR